MRVLVVPGPEAEAPGLGLLRLPNNADTFGGADINVRRDDEGAGDDDDGYNKNGAACTGNIQDSSKKRGPAEAQDGAPGKRWRRSGARVAAPSTPEDAVPGTRRATKTKPFCLLEIAGRLPKSYEFRDLFQTTVAHPSVYAPRAQSRGGASPMEDKP